MSKTMVIQDKNCFRSPSGTVIKASVKTSEVPAAGVNHTDMPFSSDSVAVNSKIKTPPSNTFNKYYFFD